MNADLEPRLRAVEILLVQVLTLLLFRTGNHRTTQTIELLRALFDGEISSSGLDDDNVAATQKAAREIFREVQELGELLEEGKTRGLTLKDWT